MAIAQGDTWVDVGRYTAPERALAAPVLPPPDFADGFDGLLASVAILVRI
ncbi:MAG: hypothetical protein Q4B45_02965 [Coriobacteriia bacterium]|nr:hypothetical protein [Coriobacteriia bacterium]